MERIVWPEDILKLQDEAFIAYKKHWKLQMAFLIFKNDNPDAEKYSNNPESEYSKMNAERLAAMDAAMDAEEKVKVAKEAYKVATSE